ncbi:glycosyltransferase [Patescibacteria group bacterium]|nr:glycosyltransferase [Patescibacteria group bacterium]
MKQLISIVIPTYNAEKTLKQCLNSILNQTYKNYEIIVVDNNSTDKTEKIIKELQRKNKKIKYLFEKRKGRGAARNTGEKKARGKIILMTDSDCIVPKNWVSEMVKAIKEYDAVQGFEQAVSDNFWSRCYQMDSKKKYEKESMKNPIGKIDTKNFAIKKEVLKKIGFTSRKYISGNDTDLSIKLAKNNCKVRFMKNIKVKHSHVDSLKKIFKKRVHHAKWTSIISRDHKKFLKNTSFLADTCQTPWTFIKFFPGIFGTLIKKGFRYAYYDFVVGISWRIGLVYGWIKQS